MIPITKLTGRLGNQMFQFAYLYTKYLDGEIYDYYLQDEKYFEKYKDAIKVIYGVGIGSIPYVGIHVRRGDYVGGTFHTNLFETGYYERAMAMFPGSSFLVFSDDIEFCKKQELFKDCEFSERDEITDMNKMASCEGIIMANSSYSWWAAYLSNARVICPKAETWFGDGRVRVGLLANWEQV